MIRSLLKTVATMIIVIPVTIPSFFAAIGIVEVLTNWLQPDPYSDAEDFAVCTACYVLTSFLTLLLARVLVRPARPLGTIAAVSVLIGALALASGFGYPAWFQRAYPTPFKYYGNMGPLQVCAYGFVAVPVVAALGGLEAWRFATSRRARHIFAAVGLAVGLAAFMLGHALLFGLLPDALENHIRQSP